MYTLQVGGMVSNNSSGMCCGVSQNTYHTLKDMRVVFADGTVLDTSDSASRAAFLEVSTLISCTLSCQCCKRLDIPLSGPLLWQQCRF
jgi:FAD binding domain